MRCCHQEVDNRRSTSFLSVRTAAGRHPKHVHSRHRVDFPLQPHQQRRLAVAARPVEDDFARRRTAAPQSAQERPAEILLVFPPGQVGRQSPVPGLKRTQRVFRVHGGRMKVQGARVNRRCSGATVPPATIELARNCCTRGGRCFGSGERDGTKDSNGGSRPRR